MLSGEVTEISKAAVLPVAQFVNRRSAGWVWLWIIASFHLDAKMGPMAHFSQNIMKGVVSYLHITTTLTSGGMTHNRMNRIDYTFPDSV